MATRRVPQIAPIPPSATPQRGLELIRRQLSLLDAVYRLHYDDPEIEKWNRTTEAVLEAVFGRPNGGPHEMKKAFENAYSGYSNQDDTQAEYDQRERESLDVKRAVLESCIEQLEILAPPIAQVAPGQYVFHAEIEGVSGQTTFATTSRRRPLDESSVFVRCY
jgi:hypothetical protein